MQDENVIATVRRYLDEVWNGGRVEVVDELLGEEFVGYGPGYLVYKGPQGIKYFMTFMNSIEVVSGGKWNYKIDDIIVQGNKVAVRMTDQENVIPKTGAQTMPAEERRRREEMTGMSVVETLRPELLVIFHVADGKIIRQWMQSNRASAASAGVETLDTTMRQAHSARKRRGRGR